jgi:hypothetical protein
LACEDNNGSQAHESQNNLEKYNHRTDVSKQPGEWFHKADRWNHKEESWNQLSAILKLFPIDEPKSE